MLYFPLLWKLLTITAGLKSKLFSFSHVIIVFVQNEGKSQATNLMTFPEFSLILCALTTSHGKSFNRIETKSILDIECRLCSWWWCWWWFFSLFGDGESFSSFLSNFVCEELIVSDWNSLNYSELCDSFLCFYDVDFSMQF